MRLRPKSKASKVSSLIGTTLMGALAMQLKGLVGQGQDPRPMGNAKFWGAAMLQGGGLRISR